MGVGGINPYCTLHEAAYFHIVTTLETQTGASGVRPHCHPRRSCSLLGCLFNPLKICMSPRIPELRVFRAPARIHSHSRPLRPTRGERGWSGTLRLAFAQGRRGSLSKTCNSLQGRGPGSGLHVGAATFCRRGRADVCPLDPVGVQRGVLGQTRACPPVSWPPRGCLCL